LKSKKLPEGMTQQEASDLFSTKMIRNKEVNCNSKEQCTVTLVDRIIQAVASKVHEQNAS
jgi:hypothetical protein